MSDYKLVPIDPTPEMVEAAEDAYMPFGDMEMAIRMAVFAAHAVQGEPGVKWAPEEVANGNKGIRWVSDEGVHGRPTDHDCRVYLESNPNARGCHCPECTMLYTAPQPEPDVAGLVEALERSVAGFVALSGMASLDAGARNYARLKAIELNGSLATYRQKGGEA